MQINYNTYLQIPKYYFALSQTLKRANGKYKLTKQDNKNEYYFIINIYPLNITLKVPFKALFKDNSKIKGIYGLSYSTALFCPSLNKGLCQIHNSNYCYAVVGEKRNINYLTANGQHKMTSYYHGLLSVDLIEQLKQDITLFNRFCNYLNESNNIKYIRINVNGDFKSINDIKLLNRIIEKTSHKITYYGYTARDDLFKQIKPHKQFYLNGSNKKYTNKYTCTYSLRQYYISVKKSTNCLGSCLICGKCFKLKNTVILNLFHNKQADIILNTFDNRMFLVTLLKVKYGIVLNEQDLKRYKGIFKSLNDCFKTYLNIDLFDKNITNIKEFLIYIGEKNE